MKMDARLALVVLSIGTKLKALFASTRKPAGQIPFGNPTGAGLDSSAGFAYDPDKNELKMSSPGNGNYTGMVSFGSYGGFGSVHSSADMFFGVSMEPGSTVGMLRRRTSDVVSYVNVRYTEGISFHTGISTNIGENFNAGTTNRRALIDLVGKMAIGDHLPTERLDVAGNVKFSGALMPGNDKGAAGMVLHSNGSVSYWAYTDTLKRTFGNWIVDTGANAAGYGILKFYYYGAFDSYASIGPNTGEGVDVVGLDFNTCYGTSLKYTPLRLATGAVILPYILGASFLKTSSTGIVSGVHLAPNGAAEGKFLTTDANGDVIATMPGRLQSRMGFGTMNTHALVGGYDCDFFVSCGLYPDSPGIFPTTSAANAIVTINKYPGYDSQLGFNDSGDIYYRHRQYHSSIYGDWVKIWHSGNFNPANYIPTSHAANSVSYADVTNWNQKVNPGNSLNHYGIQDAYTKSEVNALVASTYKAKGSKANYASLPTTGNKEGDVWNLIDTGENYVWVLDLNNTGVAGWDKLSGVVDLTGYAQQSWVTSNFAPKDFVSVEDFGAVPNNSSKGAVNQAAFASAFATGKRVYLPAGTWVLLNDLTLTGTQYLFGDSAGSAISSSVFVTEDATAVNIEAGQFTVSGRGKAIGCAASEIFNAYEDGTVNNCASELLFDIHGNAKISNLHSTNIDVSVFVRESATAIDCTVGALELHNNAAAVNCTINLLQIRGGLILGGRVNGNVTVENTTKVRLIGVVFNSAKVHLLNNTDLQRIGCIDTVAPVFTGPDGSRDWNRIATDAEVTTIKVVGKTELGASVSTTTTPVNTYIKLDDTHHTLLLTDDCDVELPDPATLQNTTFELVRLDEAKSVDFVGYNLNDNRNGTAWVPRAAFRSGERAVRIKAVQDPYSADWCWIVVGSTTY